MAEKQEMSPISPATTEIVTPPPLVARVLNDPQDEADEAMALAIRDAALTQQASDYLLTATRQTAERFALGAVASLDRVATAAKEVQAKYADPGNDIDRLMAGAMKDIVGSQIDSYKRQKEALTVISGEIATQVQNLPTIRGKIARRPAPPPPPPPQVIVQQTGPKLREARLFEGGKTKYVIDE